MVKAKREADALTQKRVVIKTPFPTPEQVRKTLGVSKKRADELMAMLSDKQRSCAMTNEQAEERTCATCGCGENVHDLVCRGCREQRQYQAAYHPFTPAPSDEPKRYVVRCGAWLQTSAAERCGKPYPCPDHGMAVRWIGPSDEPKPGMVDLDPDSKRAIYGNLRELYDDAVKDEPTCKETCCQQCGGHFTAKQRDGVRKMLADHGDCKREKCWHHDLQSVADAPTCPGPTPPVKDEGFDAWAEARAIVAEYAPGELGLVNHLARRFEELNARRSTAPVKDEGFDAAYQFGDLIKDPSKWNLDPADCHLRVPVALVSQIESELARRSTAPLDVRKAAERIALLYWPNVPFGLTREQMRDHIADELSAIMEGKP